MEYILFAIPNDQKVAQYSRSYQSPISRTLRDAHDMISKWMSKNAHYNHDFYLMADIQEIIVVRNKLTNQHDLFYDKEEAADFIQEQDDTTHLVIIRGKIKLTE